MPSKFEEFSRLNANRGFRPFNLFGANNLPTLTGSSTLATQPANVSDLFTQTVQGGLGVPPGRGGKPPSAFPTSGDPPGFVGPLSLLGVAGGQALNVFGGPPSIDFTPSRPPGLGALRRNLGVTNQNLLQQEIGEVERDATRAGLTSSGYLRSLKNAPFRAAGEREIAGEAAIAELELRAWLERQNMEMRLAIAQAELEAGAATPGDLITGIAQSLPFAFV